MRRHWRGRAFSLLAASAVVLVLAGCGGKANSAEGGSGSAKSSSTQSSSTTPRSQTDTSSTSQATTSRGPLAKPALIVQADAICKRLNVAVSAVKVKNQGAQEVL